VQATGLPAFLVAAVGAAAVVAFLLTLCCTTVTLLAFVVVSKTAGGAWIAQEPDSELDHSDLRCRRVYETTEG
jgi:hypothetical protein